VLRGYLEIGAAVFFAIAGAAVFFISEVEIGKPLPGIRIALA
jgi:hypothetical protein